MQEGENRKIPEASIDTKLLYQRLSTMKPGDFISYGDLTDIIGRDVQTIAYGNMKSARDMVQREHKKTFGVVRDEGLKCLEDNEIINTMQPAIEHVRRFSRKALKRIGCIADMAALKNEQRITMNTHVSVIGAFAIMAKPSSIKRVEAKVTETNQQIAFAKTLDAFKGNGK